MVEHLTVYLDESGDLGFDWSKSKTSKNFVITLLICENNIVVKGIKTAISRTLKNKLNIRKRQKEKVHELKGAKTSLEVKKYFIKHMPADGWSLYALAFNKRNVAEHLKTPAGKKKLYNFLSRILIEQINFPETLRSINLIVDKCKSSAEVKEFNEYIEAHLQAHLPINIIPNISHECSHTTYGLQAVDMFCWGMARKWSGDLDWYHHFKEWIKLELMYLINNEQKKDGPFNT